MQETLKVMNKLFMERRLQIAVFSFLFFFFYEIIALGYESFIYCAYNFMKKWWQHDRNSKFDLCSNALSKQQLFCV